MHRKNIFARIISGLRYRSWLKHYATSWNVVGSTHDEANGFFNLPNPSSRTALGSTRALTQMSCKCVRISQVHTNAMLER
jgi:hypothetical protein